MPPNFEEKEEDEEELEGQEDGKQDDIDPQTLEDGPKSIIVGDWSRVKGINEAIALAAENDTVFCSGGQYAEQLQIDKAGLEILGPPDMSVHVLQGVTSTATFCSITNLRIQTGIVVRCGNLTASACDIHGAVYGVQVHRTANPRVQKCNIHDIEKTHIAVLPGGNGVFEQNELSGDGRRGTVGLSLNDAEAPVFQGNTIRNVMTGVYAVRGCKGAQVVRNVITHVTGHGIYLDQQAKPTIKENEIRNAPHYGILVANESAGTLVGNVVHASVRIHTGCSPSLVGNVVVEPGEIVNDDSLYALRGIVVKKPQDLPKERKVREPPG